MHQFIEFYIIYPMFILKKLNMGYIKFIFRDNNCYHKVVMVHKHLKNELIFS